VVRLWSFFAIAVSFIVAGAVTIRAGWGRRDQWILGDWLIDYSAGFTRRGLLGEAIRQLEILFGVDRILVTTLLQLSILVALGALLLVLVSSHQRGLPTALLVASPAFVLFLLVPLGTMRKEILLWLLVAAVLVGSRLGNKATLKLIPLTLAIVFPLLVLIHEALVFYAGFVAVVLWLLVSEGTVSRRNAYLVGGVGTLLTAAAAGVSLLSPGRSDVGERICATLVATGYDDALCSGAIRFLDQDATFSLSRVVDAVTDGNYLGVYLPVIVLSSVPFFFVRWSKPLAASLALSLVMTLPLFVVTIDWGRWIVISVWLVSMIVLRFDNSPHISVTTTGKKRGSAIFGVAAMVGAVAFATLWSIPHCCEPRIGFGLIDRFADALVIFGLG
jgi:hypothetical protein